MKTANIMFIPLLVVTCCSQLAFGVTHTLQYFYTASSGIPEFPQFITAGVVDGQQIDHYDSITKKAVPKAEWIKAAVDSDYWNRNTQIYAGTEASFINNIEVAKSRFNQSGGVHIAQSMYGCQWDDESQAADGFHQDGYDGEDFIIMDLKNLRWIGTTPQSLITQRKWNNDRAHLENAKSYLTIECIDWLKKYVQYGRSTLEKKVHPEVTVIQKDSAVVCHATGFYPEGVMITFKRDGEETQEDVDVGQTLPNEDGTFQKRAVLTVSPEELKNRQYTCEVAHKSGETIVKTLPVEKTLPEEDGNTLVIIIGCGAALVVIGVIVAIVAILMMKKKVYKKAELFDTDSENSNPIARKGAECADC